MSEDKKVKKILIEIDNVRIKEYDKDNVTIERYESVYNPIAKEETNRWRFKGYSKDVTTALRFIVNKNLLIDQKDVNSLKTHLKLIQESNEKIFNELEKLK